VRTGETAFNHVHGASLFDYLARHPEEASLFNSGMAGNSPAHARLGAASYDFSKIGQVVDVAGGRGRLLATILECYPHLRGILFDLPHVIEDARLLINDAGVTDRCAFVGGNFFEAVPKGGDAYILRNIVHDWEDDQAVAILTTCRRAMADSARLILVERYLADDPREALLVLHADLSIATKYRFHIIPVRIQNKCRIIAVLAQAGCAVVVPTGLESGSIKSVDPSPAAGRESCVLADGVRMVTIDPKDRIIHAVADSIRPHAIGQLHHAAQAKRTKRCVIKRGGTPDMCHSNAGMIDHRSLLLV
jgi:hypothetical protein